MDILASNFSREKNQKCQKIVDWDVFAERSTLTGK